MVSGLIRGGGGAKRGGGIRGERGGVGQVKGQKITQRGLTEKSKNFLKRFLYMLIMKINFLMIFSSRDSIGNLEIYNPLNKCQKFFAVQEPKNWKFIKLYYWLWGPEVILLKSE